MENYQIAWLCVIILDSVLGYFSWRNWLRYKLVVDTPTSSIGSVTPGIAEIKGKAVSLEQEVVSPYSGKRCVFFHFTVDELRSSGKHSSWRNVINDKMPALIGIDDGTGIAAVDMNQAELQLDKDVHGTTGTFKGATPELKAAMNRYGQDTKGFIFEKTLRFTEIILENEDSMYVLGYAQKTMDQHLIFMKGEIPLLVSDLGEDRLANSYRMNAFGLLAGAVAFTLIILCSML